MNHWLNKCTPNWFYPHQTKLYDFIEDHDDVIITKSRQVGFTTALMYWAYKQALIGKTVNFVSPTQGMYYNNCRMLKIQPFFNTTEIELPLSYMPYASHFKSGGGIYFRCLRHVYKPKSDHLILDEIAFTNEYKEIDNWRSLTKYKVIVCSTPNHVSTPELPNWFYDQWKLFQLWSFNIFHFDRREELKNSDQIMQVVGEKAFKNEYLGEFIKN